jgi:hypothetical protein
VKAGVAVNVSTLWTDTQIDVVSRSPIKFTATGFVDVSLASKRLQSPNGDPNCNGNLGTQFLAPGLPCWSLIGRVGDGPPFFIGRSKTIEVGGFGHLFLSVNDEVLYFADNFGGWTATISIAPSSEVGAPPPNPTALMAFENVTEAIKLGFEEIPGGTLVRRLGSRGDWRGRSPADGPWRVDIEEIVAKVPNESSQLPFDPNLELGRRATDLELRETITTTLADLVGNHYGSLAKAMIVRAIVDSVAEALPALPPTELSQIRQVLDAASSDGLTPAIKARLCTPKYAGYLAAACEKAISTTRLLGSDDLLLVRYRGKEGPSHHYDLFVTWREDPSMSRGGSATRPVALPLPPQGYARHELAIGLDSHGSPQVKGSRHIAFYSPDLEGLWQKGLLALK